MFIFNYFMGKGESASIQNSSSSFDNYFNDLMTGLTEENKTERTLQIKEIFASQSSILISELQKNSANIGRYHTLENCLNQIDPKLTEEIHPFIEKIQRISGFLRKTDENLIDYENLNNFDQIRSIKDPDFKGYLMAKVYNRMLEEDTSLDKEDIPFSKEEIIAMGPYLKHFTYTGKKVNWNAQEIEDILKACPNLKSLTLKKCNIERLPPMLYCQTVSIDDCRFLRQITSIPFCKTLNCSNCPLLAASSDLPNVVNATFSNCPNLVALPALPNAQYVNCSSCQRLAVLTDLPKCINLDCTECPSLAALPALPNCRKLDCSDCLLLAALPDLPNAIQVFCQNCILLTAMPALPNCRRLNFLGCIALDTNTVPQRLLPRGFVLNVHSGLMVNMEDMTNNPLKVLLESSKFLLEGTGIPMIKFKEADGRISRGVDAGGLTRSFLTKIIESLISNSEVNGQLPFERFEETSFYFPVITPDLENALIKEQQIAGYRVIGALIAECIKQNYVIDQVFPPKLFEAIFSFSSADLEAMPEPPDDLHDDVRLKLLVNMFPNEKAIAILNKSPENLTPDEIEDLKGGLDNEEDKNKPIEWIFNEVKRSYINRKNEVDRLLPAAIIAKQMHSLMTLRGMSWDAFRSKGVEKIQEQLHGSLKADVVIKALQWKAPEEGVNQEDVERTKNFVEEWVKNASKEDLRDFIFAITGLPSISEKSELKMKLYNGGREIVPNVHTCFNTMDLSVNYPNQDTFNLKLKWLVDQVRSKELSGFEEA